MTTTDIGGGTATDVTGRRVPDSGRLQSFSTLCGPFTATAWASAMQQRLRLATGTT
jgi:hypothetical protein